MEYKVIWDNGRNSVTYKTLEVALWKIKSLIKGCPPYYTTYNEVKIEVIKDKGE